MNIGEYEGVVIFGATGFLGKHLEIQLNTVGVSPYIIRKLQANLLDNQKVNEAFEHIERHGVELNKCCVFHLAGNNGGIAYNVANPADIFFQNTMMALNVIEACHRYSVKKVVSVVASCAFGDVPTSDGVLFSKDFFNWTPHETVACHGYAKRNLQLASKYFWKQHQLNAVCVCPTTLYGPGDSFNPQKTKLMGGLIKRFVDAVDNDEDKVICWGSGNVYREFLYVEDAAKLLIKSMENYGNSDTPLNLGTGQELSVRSLAEIIAKLTTFKGKISWDTSKPDGQHRKRLDLTEMHRTIGDFTPVPLENGILQTVEFYRGQKAAKLIREEGKLAT